MKFLVASLLLLSSLAFAGEKMGNEAVEMAEVLTHPQVKECLKDINLNFMINVEIEKQVFRCPGCTHYKITGRELNIDIPSSEITVIEIKGERTMGMFHQPVQNYECSVKTE